MAQVPSRAIKDAQIDDEILKGYMASGEFSRGTESIRAEGGIVMVGNFDNSSNASATFSAPCHATGATTRPSMTGSTPMLPQSQ
jgi:predicted ATP-dependent Lon-type protease